MSISRFLLVTGLFLAIREVPVMGAAAQKKPTYDPEFLNFIQPYFSNRRNNDVLYVPKQTALIDAVLGHDCDYAYGSVAALLDYGVDINETDETGKTALMYASNEGDDYSDEKTLVDLLCSKKSLEINKKDPYGQTALMYAIVHWAPEKNIQTMLQAKADCSLKTDEGQKAIDLARERNWNLKVIQMLADGESAQKAIAIISLDTELGAMFNERSLVAGHHKESLAAFLGLFPEE